MIREFVEDIRHREPQQQSKGESWRGYLAECERLGIQVGDTIKGRYPRDGAFEGVVERLPRQHFPNIWIREAPGDGDTVGGVLPAWVTHINGTYVRGKPQTLVLRAESGELVELELRAGKIVSAKVREL